MCLFLNFKNIRTLDLTDFSVKHLRFMLYNIKVILITYDTNIF